MRTLIASTKFFKLMLIGLFISNFSAYAQKTTVWVVRHAEKDTLVKADAADPGLSTDGLKRAAALANRLERANIQAIYTTTAKRAVQTGAVIAQHAKITPVTYNDDLKKLADDALKNNSGSNVLIIGHSNTVMPILTAFGVQPPFITLDEKDYDMLFKITVNNSGPADLDIYRYGKSHHKSQVPSKYLDAHRSVQPVAKTPTSY